MSRPLLNLKPMSDTPTLLEIDELLAAVPHHRAFLSMEDSPPAEAFVRLDNYEHHLRTARAHLAAQYGRRISALIEETRRQP